MSGRDAGLSWWAGQAQGQASLLAALDAPAWLVEADQLTVLQANAAAGRFLDRPTQDLVGQDAQSLLPSLEDLAFWGEVRAGQAGALDSELDLPRPGGGEARMRRRISRLPDTEPAVWLVQLQDLSSEHAAQREREHALAELRATLEATADGILVTDLGGGIRAFNRRFAHLWSLPAQALEQRDDERVHAWMALQTTQPQAWRDRLASLREHCLTSATDTVRLVDGSLLECHTQPQWSQGRPIGRVFSFRELNRLRPGAPRRDEDHAPDAGSRLPHRSSFVARVDDALAQARGSGASLVVICVDVDAQLLWGAPDAALPSEDRWTAVVKLLRAGLPSPAMLARLGATRCGVLLENASEAKAEAVARRWQALAAADSAGAMAAPVVGVAAYPQAGASADELLGHAEKALARAHALGESCRTHHSSGESRTQRQQRLESALRDGLARPQFRLQYQPRVDIHSGQPCGLEALVRWKDPLAQRELLPAQFLPLAVRAGLSATLDEWVLSQAIQQSARWRTAGLMLPVSVNLSAASLLRPGLARRIEALLAHGSVPPEALALELGEDALTADPEATAITVRALRALGLGVVLDGFGRGESSATLLQRLPLCAVKLDRSVLHDATRHAQGAAWLRGTAALVRALGLECQAVGVESEAQRQALAQAGGQSWQGFLHGAALDAQRVPGWCARVAAAAA
ncbi:MAG: EAL domain-containing protein [Burkholderiales bacterium]|nr:EAL domain-containing protein [Burkholderiales bacterium]